MCYRMAKLQCANSNGYSSPVPIIGLYIAIASLVCLLLMLWDIFFAIRRKNRHIPCRRFSLNSVTLTLLAIVAKLPVDLTTNMPSARDQLSKLSGTAMTCICIGFMALSVVSSKESESVSNMASLSIFIVTVASTGNGSFEASIFFHEEEIIKNLNNGLVPRIVGKLRCCAHKDREDTASSTLDSWRNELKMWDRLSQRLIGVCVDNMSKWMNVKRDPPRYQHMNGKVQSEAFEIVYYIDKKINVESDDSGKRQLAKLIWEGGEIDLISKKVLLENDNNRRAVKFAISNVKRAFEILYDGLTSFELQILWEFIEGRVYEKFTDLCDSIEQLFCEMLQHFLSQLPISVFKEVNDSSFENWEERGRFITKRLVNWIHHWRIKSSGSFLRVGLIPLASLIPPKTM
ncbi:hypothetical protein Sjap_009470 [Stephania japonica]|uniref:Uncharacterized protein n=1 Tax=Stephania japonica TaxID=461633 RepID=A0AAP0JRF5_9MAGN